MGVKAGLSRFVDLAASYFRKAGHVVLGLLDPACSRESIAFFIEYCEGYRSRIEALAADGEDPDEICESMLLYEDQLTRMAGMSIYQHPFDPHKVKELKIDNITPLALSDLFFRCLAYAGANPRIYRRIGKSRIELVRNYVRLFGKPHNASEMALKAETAGDAELASLLEA